MLLPDILQSSIDASRLTPPHFTNPEDAAAHAHYCGAGSLQFSFLAYYTRIAAFRLGSLVDPVDLLNT